MEARQKATARAEVPMTVSPRWAALPLFVSLFASAQQSPPTSPSPSPEQIVAYLLPQRGMPVDPATIAANKITRLNYAFFRIRDGLAVEGSPQDAANLIALHRLKQRNPHLQILVSVGGGGRGSAGYSDLAISPEGRRRFAASAVAIVRKYDLDGVDVDWEYPGYTNAGNRVRPEDKTNYTLLLKELRLQLDAAGKSLGRHLVTSSATGATQIWLDHTDMREASKWLDGVNLMCYDWYNEVEPNTGHDSPLFTNPADPKGISIAASVQKNLAAGVPPEKLIIGVPFYGREWTGVGPTNHGLWQPITPSAPAPIPTPIYAQIAPLVNAQGYTRFWDNTSQAPFLYNASTRTFITYNDAQAELARAKFVREHHLGGMMFWEYTGDPQNVLLDAIDRGLRQ